MATPGKPIDEQTRRILERLTRHGKSRRFVARECQISKTTAQKYATKQEAERAERDGNEGQDQ